MSHTCSLPAVILVLCTLTLGVFHPAFAREIARRRQTHGRTTDEPRTVHAHTRPVRVAEVLGKRMERFGLRLHPEKTRLIAFERPEAGQRSGKGPATFDFLGFTMYWRRTRRGHWQMWCKTRSKGLRRFNRMVSEWCRRHRHLPVQVQHAALTRRLAGHFNYFGVNGNHRSLARVVHATQRVWRKWLRRRSQRTRLTWERFIRLLERFPLPRPRVVVRIWGA